ncbi:hypothetical protein QYE76_002509 [Lolium multiflorum]|uniref:Reverse transcriptase Ty1/copia-type domain-containing protein n=1 Tax=Lolium multiflorum TaxID=4521 RepID=A0AAD8RNH3_LOLMU|nr:hypothetical protein QYE76_002509 [Lolium multiflorum]
MIVDNNDEDPATYEEAMMSPDSNKWQEAMKSEMGSMYDNKVWTLVDLPDSRKAVENKWIFKRKQMLTMDVKTAFLNGDIEEELYMVQPKGFVDPKNADMMLDALKMYNNQNEDKDFSFMHCFNNLQSCKNWYAIHHTLNKDGEDGSVDPAGASTGRPIGNKKAKAENNAAPALAAMDASLEKKISSFSMENNEAADRAAVVWKAILEKQDMKIELKRETVEAAKMEAHDAAMKATNEATQLSLAKMSQESKILMADVEKIHPLARDWHEMYRERTGHEVLAARAASATPPAPLTFMTTPAPSTFMPSPAPLTFMPPPATVDPVAAMELSPGLADDEDAVEVQPPMTPFI